MSEDAEIEPRTVANLVLITRLDLIHIHKDLLRSHFILFGDGVEHGGKRSRTKHLLVTIGQKRPFIMLGLTTLLQPVFIFM